MPSQNIINVESRIILGSVSKLHRDKLGRLSHPVHYNPYGVILFPTPGKTNPEVYINGLSLSCRNLNNLSKTARLKMFCLKLLSVMTLGHMFNNVFIHSIPPIDLLKIMIHLGGTWMYGIFRFMGLYNNHGLQIIHIRYTQPILVPKYAFTSQSERLIHLYQC